jgi:23S rRNA pseudouridine1911/1915/1917 synthase
MPPSATHQPTHRATQWIVAEDRAGHSLAALVREHMGVSWNQAKKHVTTGKVFVDGAQRTAIDLRPRPGQTIELRMNAPRPVSGSDQVRIVHEDTHVVVIDKPAGLNSVPYEPRDTSTAMDRLRDAWRRKYPDASRVPLHVVHRIDKATSGLLAFAKTKRAELGLAAQFRRHTIERFYLCVAHGRVVPGRIESRLVRDRGDGLRGSSRHPDQGKRAVTQVEVIDNLARATFCRVRLETGKTHQIRIHLAERGHPLVGEAVYIRDFVAAGKKPIESPRLLLHAAALGFLHPITGKRLYFESPLPDDFARVLRALGGAQP